MKPLLVAAVSLTLLVTVSAQMDPFEGTWTLNIEKSRLAQPLKAATMTLRIGVDEENFQRSAEQLSLEMISVDGVRDGITYTALYSGRPGGDYWIFNLVTGQGTGEEAVVRRIDENTREFSRLRAVPGDRLRANEREIVETTRRTLSADGLTMTAEVVFAEADGSPVEEVWIWDRQ